MVKPFDFSNVENSKKIIKKTWDEFRSCLANKQFLYNDIDAALSVKFLHVFNDLFEHGHMFLDKPLADILSNDVSIVRAARIKEGDPIPTFDRFIPNAKFIRESNRFSPPRTEWLYLAFAPSSDVGDLSLEEKCALKECRAAAGEQFALCSFRLTDLNKGGLLVDLTIAKEEEYDEINRRLERTGQEIIRRERVRILTESTGILKKPQIEDIKPSFTEWAVYTYARLLSEEIFLPITTEDKELMYAPFQCIAQYFLSKGYCGIVYSSTVFPEGKNVVLFDKQTAEPFGDIKNIIIPENF